MNRRHEPCGYRGLEGLLKEHLMVKKADLGEAGSLDQLVDLPDRRVARQVSEVLSSIKMNQEQHVNQGMNQIVKPRHESMRARSFGEREGDEVN